MTARCCVGFSFPLSALLDAMWIQKVLDVAVCMRGLIEPMEFHEDLFLFCILNFRKSTWHVDTKYQHIDLAANCFS